MLVPSPKFHAYCRLLPLALAGLNDTVLPTNAGVRVPSVHDTPGAVPAVVKREVNAATPMPTSSFMPPAGTTTS